LSPPRAISSSNCSSHGSDREDRPFLLRLVQPRVHRRGDSIELPRKEVVGTFDQYELLRLGQPGKQRLELRLRAELIVSALDDQFRFPAALQETHIDVIDRQTQPHQSLNALVPAPHAQTNPRSETEARQKDRLPGKFLRQVIDRRADVVLFAPPVVVRPPTLADAPKIESQHSRTSRMQRFGRLVHDFIVHRATVERMRMAHDGDERRLRARGSPKQRFQAAREPGQEKISMKNFCHQEVREALLQEGIMPA